MTQPLLDVDDVLDDLQIIVSEFGDGYVYPPEHRESITKACVYAAANGTPRCIVGHVLARRDLLHFLKLGDGYHNGTFDRADTVTKFFTLDAVGILCAAQTVQDNCRPWGDALIMAKELAAKI